MGDSAVKLQQLLENQVSASEDFLALLFAERETISKNLIEQLPELTQKKLELIETLTQTEIGILSCLKETSGEDTAEQAESVIQKIDPNNEYQLLALLKKAQNLAIECKNENLINSQIVEGCQSQVEQTLDVLLKRDKPSVYSAAGKTVKRGVGSLGEA